jgi:glycerol-3-phosphate acyltransferase PlsY
VGEWESGAANIFRELGPKYASTALLLDLVRGTAATVPLWVLGIPTWVRLLAMVALLAGHLFLTLWRFRGGTGMITFFGITVGLLPIGVLIGAPIGIANFGLFRSVGWSGGAFMFATALAGGLISRDVFGVVAVPLGAVAVFVRQIIRYRYTPPPEKRIHLPTYYRESASD